MEAAAAINENVNTSGIVHVIGACECGRVWCLAALPVSEPKGPVYELQYIFPAYFNGHGFSTRVYIKDCNELQE